MLPVVLGSAASPFEATRQPSKGRPETAHRYNCNEGTCKSCDMLCNGDRVPVCVARMPDWDVEVAYGLRGAKEMGLDRRSP